MSDYTISKIGSSVMTNKTVMINHNKQFISISEISETRLDFYIDVLPESKISEFKNKKIYFYNRLNVYFNFRCQGFGTLLLKETLNFLEDNSVLINTPNAYGDMKQTDLIKFYIKHGFVQYKDLLIYER